MCHVHRYRPPSPAWTIGEGSLNRSTSFPTKIFSLQGALLFSIRIGLMPGLSVLFRYSSANSGYGAISIEPHSYRESFISGHGGTECSPTGIVFNILEKWRRKVLFAHSSDYSSHFHIPIDFLVYENNILSLFELLDEFSVVNKGHILTSSEESFGARYPGATSAVSALRCLSARRF